MTRHHLPLLAILALAATALAQDPNRHCAAFDRMAAALNDHDFAAVSRDFAPVMLDALPPDKSIPFFRNLIAQCGRIESADPPRLLPLGQAVFPVHFERAVLDVTIVLDNDDRISGLWFRPHTPAIPAPEKNATELRLPFQGRWKVVWGGDTPELNQHHDTPNQKHAFDFLQVDPNGHSYCGDGARNEDYYAFGQDVLAPAVGRVTDVIRGVRDNTPGSMNPYSALGNAVIIEHRENEFSVIAHFQQDSITVNVGDHVTQGQLLGRCGNSGNSSEPHIHYHLQNTPIIQDGTAIPATFQNLILTTNDETSPKIRYSPIKNDLVAPQ